MARREARARKGSGAGSGQEGKGLPAALILLPFFEVSYCFPRCLKFVSQPGHEHQIAQQMHVAAGALAVVQEVGVHPS